MTTTRGYSLVYKTKSAYQNGALIKESSFDKLLKDFTNVCTRLYESSHNISNMTASIDDFRTESIKDDEATDESDKPSVVELFNQILTKLKDCADLNEDTSKCLRQIIIQK